MSVKNAPIFIVDIDDILYDLNLRLRDEGVRQGFVARPGEEPAEGQSAYYEPRDIEDWSFTVRQMGALENFLTVLTSVYSSDEMTPHIGAVDGCKALTDAGYEVHYFTDRPDGTEELTRAWLTKMGFPSVDNLHVCSDKRAEIKKLERGAWYKRRRVIIGIIDDRIRTMLWARYDMKIPHVFALKTAYNQNMSDAEGMHLAKNWSELIQIIFAVLPERKTDTV